MSLGKRRVLLAPLQSGASCSCLSCCARRTPRLAERRREGTDSATTNCSPATKFTTGSSLRPDAPNIASSLGLCRPAFVAASAAVRGARAEAGPRAIDIAVHPGHDARASITAPRWSSSRSPSQRLLPYPRSALAQIASRGQKGLDPRPPRASAPRDRPGQAPHAGLEGHLRPCASLPDWATKALSPPVREIDKVTSVSCLPIVTVPQLQRGSLRVLPDRSSIL